MSNLSLRHLYKVYPNGVKAVNDFNMEIGDREFIVFVGPSGCGKSTTLRMIAGLEEITAGELYIGDQFANHVEPKDRDIAMVFQNYALYPHMTVYENLAFGLKLRHVPQAEIHQKVLWAAKILKLEEYLERKPKALSGGQRQRVSLGRAILRTPKVFLLDEPLSNLDAKLRTEMRAEIAKLHNEIATTFIYVTHDQVEAMTMGTRIVVMSMGYVQQIDTPQNLYNYPENKFVAGFIGTPQMNFFDVRLTRRQDVVDVAFEGLDTVLRIPFEQMLKVKPEYLTGEKTVVLGLRCENISANAEKTAASQNLMQMKISHFEELGNETLIYGDLNLSVSGLGDSKTSVIVKYYGGQHNFRMGETITVAFDMARAHFFDGETEETIVPRVPKENVFDVSFNEKEAELLGETLLLPPALQKQLAQLTPGTHTGYMRIATNALYEGGSGLTAAVTETEEINGVKLVHLVRNGRTFFMTGNRDYTPGEELSLGIDYKNIALQDEDGTAWVTPLPEFDTLFGSYFDRSNNKRSVDHLVRFYEDEKKKALEENNQAMVKELAPVILDNSLIKARKAAYEARCRELQENMSFRLGAEDLSKKGKEALKKETKAALAAAKADYEKDAAAFKAQKEAFDKLPEQEKAVRRQEEKRIRSAYAEIAHAIEEKYEALIAQAKGGLERVEKELLPLEVEKQESAKTRLAAAEAAYKQEKAARTEELDKAVADAKARAAAAQGEKRDVAMVEAREARRRKKDELEALQADYDRKVDDILFESKVFAAYIHGVPRVTSLDINKKIVKGLGAQLFLSHYRFELPHDGYEIAPGGIDAQVQEVLNYGKERFARCSFMGNDLYVKVEQAQAGEKLSLLPKVEQARIFENKFDIRLY